MKVTKEDYHIATGLIAVTIWFIVSLAFSLRLSALETKVDNLQLKSMEQYGIWSPDGVFYPCDRDWKKGEPHCETVEPVIKFTGIESIGGAGGFSVQSLGEIKFTEEVKESGQKENK